jgi:hypothetical protein
MPIVPQSEPASRAKTRPRSFQVFPADELADFMSCTPEQLGVLMRLRWYAWYHDGLPNSEELLLQLRKSFGVSAQKFRKFWPFLSTFFTETSGILRFSADESRRQEMEERTAKQQEAGKKRAEQMWGNRGSVPKTNDSLAIASYPPLPVPPLQEEVSTNVDLPPATDQQQPAGEMDRDIESLQTAVGEQWHVLVARAVNLGLQAPDKATAIRILKRFPDIPPDSFPLLPGQKSSALWLHKDPMDLELEIRRQRETNRKPVQMTRLDQIMEKFVNGE